MISKELFVEIMHNIKTQEDRVEKFCKGLDELCDGFPVFDTNNLYLKSLIDLLGAVFNDSADYIGWWLWEDVEKVVIENDCIEHNLSSPEQLYDFLVYNMKEE